MIRLQTLPACSSSAQDARTPQYRVSDVLSLAKNPPRRRLSFEAVVMSSLWCREACCRVLCARAVPATSLTNPLPKMRKAPLRLQSAVSRTQCYVYVVCEGCVHSGESVSCGIRAVDGKQRQKLFQVLVGVVVLARSAIDADSPTSTEVRHS